MQRDTLLLASVLALPLATLELFHMVIQDKVGVLQEEDKQISKGKEEAAEVADAFAKEGLRLVSKRQGRKVDPNSKTSRVSKAIYDLLKASPEGVATDIAFWQEVSYRTGLGITDCKVTAQNVKGIKKNYGFWTLLEAA